ncbi:hypothetical protein ACLB2K_054762 [Fragaria x ananassa]
MDADNGLYVVAWAMVEAESKDSWIWFLELLGKDLNIEHEGRGWIFISDKQKGLIPAFGQIVSRAEIRFCVRHLWTNFTKLFPGMVLKDQMWAYAKSTTLPYFQKAMKTMKELELDAYKWLTAKERPAKHWCRAYFNTVVDCDIMINNICESFNGWILEARGKSPVTMFEELRVKLMKRIANRKRKMEAYHGNICPKIRRWDLSGIPCKHAISSIYLKRENPDDYVSRCYLKTTYMSIYNNLIQLVNNMDLWSRGEDPPIQPPQYSRQPGRPKKTRDKAAYEKQKDAATSPKINPRALGEKLKIGSLTPATPNSYNFFKTLCSPLAISPAINAVFFCKCKNFLKKAWRLIFVAEGTEVETECEMRWQLGIEIQADIKSSTSSHTQELSKSPPSKEAKYIRMLLRNHQYSKLLRFYLLPYWW